MTELNDAPEGKTLKQKILSRTVEWSVIVIITAAICFVMSQPGINLSHAIAYPTYLDMCETVNGKIEKTKETARLLKDMRCVTTEKTYTYPDDLEALKTGYMEVMLPYCKEVGGKMKDAEESWVLGEYKMCYKDDGSIYSMVSEKSQSQ